jgi:Domain of unknown function (DUF4352)
MNRILGAAMLLLGMLAVACGGDDADVLSTDDGTTSVADAPTKKPTAAEKPTEEAPATSSARTATATTAAGSSGNGRANPAKIGSLVDTGDWKVVVNKVTPDAAAAILAENSFNDPPEAGRQYFMVHVSATYDGDEDSDSAFSLSFKAVGESNVAYSDFEDDCGLVPDDLPVGKDVFKGGTVSGNICWSVKTTDAGSLLMYVEDSFSSKTKTWFALK